MTAIWIKELRENARWTLVGALALLGAMMWSLYTSPMLSIVDDAFQAVTAIGFPGAALLLGIAQMLQDDWRGRRDFIVHRPISRSAAFAGKVLAGLPLYLLGTLVPLALVTAWVATPGHVLAPFNKSMLLPALADVASGIVAYFAGLLVGARPARWIGTRLLPVGLAVATVAVVGVVAITFAQALLAVLVALVIVIPAAWGAFVATGTERRPPIIARLLQALCVTVGMGMVVALAVGIGGETLRVLFAGPSDYTYTYWTMAGDGRVLRVTASATGINEITDPSGAPVEGPPEEVLRHDDGEDAETYSLSLHPLRGPGVSPRMLQWMRYRNPGAYLETFGVADGAITWFHVVPRRTIEGVHSITYQPVGSIGPSGFVPVTQPPQPFAGPLVVQLDPIVATPTTAYALDLKARTAQVLFTTTVDDPIISGARASMYRSANPRDSALFAVLTRSMLRTFEAASEVARVPVSRETGYDWLTVSKPADGATVLFYQAGYDEQRGPLPGRVVRIDAAGQVVADAELPPLPRSIVHDPWYFEALMGTAVPPGIVAVIPMLDHGDMPPRRVLILMALASLAWMAVALWHARRYAMGRGMTIAWMITVALIGITALLTMFSVHNRPARVPCPTCGKRRLVTRERCEHCDGPFPAPPMTGVEILDIAPDNRAAASLA